MKYQKYKQNGYNLHTITTDRFKTIYVAIHLKRKSKKEEITIRNFLADLLLSSTKKFPTLRELEIEVEELYSMSASPASYISGNYDVISITGTFLNEQYTEPGMNEASISFLMDFLYQPNVENDSFAQAPFELEYQMLKEDLESLKDNPTRYSKIRLHELMGKDTPLSYHGFGYLEDLNKITPENLYTYYEDVLKNDILDIFVVGNFDSDEMRQLVEKKIPNRTEQLKGESHFVDCNFEDRSIQMERETLPVQQSRLAVGLKASSLTEFERKYILNVYSFILGGSSDSKLFMNVREKNSLCYSISASPSMIYGTVEIQAGISADSYEKTLSLIQETIEKMTDTIEEADIEKAIATYLSGCEEVADSQSAIVANYLSHEYLNNDLLEVKKKKIKEITVQDVKELAKKMYLDSVFFLEGSRSNAEK